MILKEKPVRPFPSFVETNRVIIAIVILMAICAMGLLIWEYPNHAPTPTPKFLLLSESAFPTQWTSDNIHTHRVYEGSDGADYGAYLEFAPTAELSDNGQVDYQAGQIIYSYPAFNSARRGFAKLYEDRFESTYYSAWQSPFAIDATSTVADQYRFGCGTHLFSGNNTCVMIARYGQYVSKFWFDTNTSNLSDAEIQNVLTAIDQQFIEMGVKE